MQNGKIGMQPLKTQLFTQFNGYPSIQNSSNSKFIRSIYKNQLNNEQILWVCTQKIHGANFTICYDFQSQTIKYGRRKDFISKQIPVGVKDVGEYFIEKFFQAEKLVATFHSNLCKLKENVDKLYQNVRGVQIFGEFFGGFFPNVQCKIRVQPGVYYTPNHQFMVFDIKLHLQNYQKWVKVTQIQQIVGGILKYVPIYKKGSLEDLIKINTQINSTIPGLLGLKLTQRNICEGLIIRPNQNYMASSRVIIKKKNQQFLQKVKHKAPEVKLQFGPYHKYICGLSQYMNQNRIQSALSKQPDFQSIMQLKDLISTDILEDALKDGFLYPQDQKLKKQVDKRFDITLFKYLREYLEKENIKPTKKQTDEINGNKQNNQHKIQENTQVNETNKIQQLK